MFSLVRYIIGVAIRVGLYYFATKAIIKAVKS